MKKKEAELLLLAALESEKKERERLAKDIHDGLNGDLLAVKNFTHYYIKLEENKEKISILTQIEEGINQAIENSRIISYKLMPPILEEKGYTIALKEYVDKIKLNSDIEFNIISNETSKILNNELAYELFRVSQEFISNLIKYNTATSCIIDIKVEKDKGTIEIIDNGTSFAFFESLKTSKGLGIRNIVSRIKAINGSLEQKKQTIGNHFIISFNFKKE